MNYILSPMPVRLSKAVALRYEKGYAQPGSKLHAASGREAHAPIPYSQSGVLISQLFHFAISSFLGNSRSF
jgi:hypothetical protein